MTLTVLPLTGIPEVTRGDDLAALLLAGVQRAGARLQNGDVLVVSSKVVSKALGLREPAVDTDARAAAVARHSVRVLAERRTGAGVTQVVHAHAGPVLAAAGLDMSNTGHEGGVLVLPPDPDASARMLREQLLGWLTDGQEDQDRPPRIGVVLSDTAGRPWRVGQTDFALGTAAVRTSHDLRGGSDADGRALTATDRAVADEVAAAADLVKGKVDRVPAALVRGLPDGTVLGPDEPDPGAAALVRTGQGDWFALGHLEAVRSALGAPPGSAEAELVGIPSVLQEPEADRVRRAIRLAALGQGEGTVVTFGPVLRVDWAQPHQGHRVAARLEIALAAERVEHSYQVRVGR